MPAGRSIFSAGALLLCAALPLSVLRAQISPGELSSAHAGLEGLGNCTSCHALGKAVENQRCLSCHADLDKRIRAGRGFHSSLGTKQCTQCHKEHHGRDFSLVRWEENSFDHASTGFGLVGKHRRVACRNCHAPERIRDAEVLKSKGAGRTFLGLSRECAACHQDPHAGSLGAQCTMCHGIEAWKPAQGFSHDKTRFPLSGKHQSVRCESCHGQAGVKGVVVRYRGLPFRTCADCHRDPHAGKFTRPCEGCHTTGGWESAGKKFDHAQTRFALRGKHALVDCARCHTVPASLQGSRSRFLVARFSRCSDCHADPHGGQFAARKDGGVCSSCHSERGWRPVILTGFDHGTTRFPLRGKHATVACAVCHVPQQRLPATVGKINAGSFSQCGDCHLDVHRGQFVRRADKGKCESCHRETGFRPSTYLMPAHTEARFPLDGAHEAVACDRCHTISTTGGEKVRRFRWEKLPDCETCHRDVHGGKFGVAGCVSCHSTAAWSIAAYDHSRTGFRLDGKHRSVPCAGCHRQGVAQQGTWRFRGTPTRCAGCHSNVREG